MFDIDFAEKYGGLSDKMHEHFTPEEVVRIREEFNKRYPKIRRHLMLEQLDSYDWECAFEYAGERPHGLGRKDIRAAHPMSQVSLAPFTREDVTEIRDIDEGEGDGEEWICVGLLKDGRWFSLVAGCCYTGWDCEASGGAAVAFQEDALLRFGLSVDERLRLGILL